MSTPYKVGGVRVIPNTDGSQTNSLDLASKSNAHAVKLKAPDTVAADVAYVLPGAAGSPGSVLTDAAGNGILSWADVSGQYATKAGVQQESYTYAPDTGTANAYAIALAPTPTIVAGSEATLKVANTNTGASTLSVNGGSATAVKKESATGLVDLASGDWRAGALVDVKYDGTQWQWTGGGAGLGTSNIRQGFVQYYLAGIPPASASGYANPTGNLTTFQIAGNFTGSWAKIGANPTSSTTVTFSKNGTSFGTLVISTGGAFTWATTGGAAVSFTPGSDELSWSFPGTADATLSDVRFGIAVQVS